MKVKAGVVAAVLALGSIPAMAEQVVAEVGDTTVGAGLGVSTGLMVGGAAGGPLGALVGAGAGLWLGRTAQQAGGLEERAYQVRDGMGELDIVRSPTAQFAVGDRVDRRGNRLYAVP
ncbi:hypothetical protein [Halopseudomonas formosensis]|uniref:Glycine zipper domain-containing protein n=1 Tax=Halopseudomonas formosensis TaxID=1002526 RepID=A0ABU5BUK2_9GAMM|nr:hypothetical protein [Halopseudomonas formosensis]MDX9686237.1 hypothetical protein [Halopseudomonas formosensis]